MTALTKDRNTAERDGENFVYAVGAGKTIHAGSLVVLDAGLAEPGNTAAVGKQCLEPPLCEMRTRLGPC